MHYLHDFQYYSGDTTKHFGSKAANLGKLMFNGYRVPNGVVVAPDEELANHIGMDAALDWLTDAGFNVYESENKFAVRSSGLAEDGEDSSFAGQHDTYLNVDAMDVLEHVIMCRESAEKARPYREARGEEDKGIAVLVQMMVPAVVAGVTFTSDPFNMDLGTSVIEYTKGLGDKLVSGEVNPTNSFEVNNGTNTFIPNLSYAERQEYSLNKVHHQCQGIADLFSKPMDIEWVVDGAGIVWILQARPITTGNKKWNYPEFVGRSVVKGRAEGLGVWGVKDGNNTHFDEGNILLAVMTDPHMVPLMMKSSGIATQIGGRTCHAAIVSRELNKPCVVGIGNLSTLQSRTQIVLDANEGKVIV